MPLSPAQKLLLFSGGTSVTPAQSYDARVMATSPLRYNKLNETSGTDIVDSSGNAYTGTYNGVTLGSIDSPFSPDKAASFDGVNDYGSIGSAAFNSAFNMDEFTVMIWFKVSDASVWTDGVARTFFRFFRDANNFTRIQKASGNNSLTFLRVANGVTKTHTIASQSDTGFVCLTMSCSVAGGGLLNAGDLRFYKGSSEFGTVQTGNVASTGTGLENTATTLGANSSSGAFFAGSFSRFIIWARPIDASILALGTV